MLVQWPGQIVRPSNKREENDEPRAMERARALPMRSVAFVSYDPHAGGWKKRAIDLALVVLSAPLWAPALGVFVLWAKRRGGAVFMREPRIGYGGEPFMLLRFRLSPPSSEIVPLHPDAAAEPNEAAAPALDRWRPLIERLPMLLNIMRGEMSFVGPRVRDKAGLDALEHSKKFYLSARPGLFALTDADIGDEAEMHACKLYGRLWMFETDLDVMRRAWRAWRAQRHA